MEEMKKCSGCGEEIKKIAKKCPKCQKDLRNWFIQHWIITIILGFIILGVIGSAGVEPEPTTSDIANNISIDKPTEKIDVVEINAKKLAEDYEKNEVRADGLYKDKFGKITGKIQDIGVVFDTTYVTLDSEKDFGFISIQCFIKQQDEINKVSNLNKGDIVTFVGKIKGKSMNVEVEDCILK